MHLLEKAREKHGLKKVQMAQKLGISKSAYSMIIHGQLGISKKVALKAFEVFGIPLEEILYFSEDTPSRPQQAG